MSDFESFCSRMWLDHCDENNTLHSECLSKDAYVERWHDWLVEKWNDRDFKDDDKYTEEALEKIMSRGVWD